jgi:hypothetical protein
LAKYEAILLQNLYHQRLLEKLIRKNISSVCDFDWLN